MHYFGSVGAGYIGGSCQRLFRFRFHEQLRFRCYQRVYVAFSRVFADNFLDSRRICATVSVMRAYLYVLCGGLCGTRGSGVFSVQTRFYSLRRGLVDGDILFAVVNLARWNKIDAEQALLRANKKFEKRFRKMEELAEKPLTEYTFEEFDALWKQAKKS